MKVLKNKKRYVSIRLKSTNDLHIGQYHFAAAKDKTNKVVFIAYISDETMRFWSQRKTLCKYENLLLKIP